MIKITRSKFSRGRYRFDASHEGTHLGTMWAVKRGPSYMLTAGAQFFGVAPTLKEAEGALRRKLEENLPALLALAVEVAS